MDPTLALEFDELRAEAEALEPRIRDLCRRARAALGLRHSPDDLADDDPAVRLQTALVSLASHLRAVIDGLPPMPDWAEDEPALGTPR